MRSLFLFFLIPVTLIAQTDDSFQPEWAYGLNAGVTLSTTSFNPTIPQSSYLQYIGGVTGRYISERHWGLQLELNYSQRGWNEYHPDDPSLQYSRQLNYLEFPLCSHLYFDMGKRFRLFFIAGPQLGFLLSENESSGRLSETEEERQLYGKKRPLTEEERSLHHDMTVERKLDWGICGGGGLELRTGIGSFLLEGRYYFGLSDIFNNSKADYFAASANKITCIKLSYLVRIQ